jgi:hypothetical protein
LLFSDAGIFQSVFDSVKHCYARVGDALRQLGGSNSTRASW